MASEVDICNTALGHIGKDDQVSSISPPDGSTAAGYCARFYPIARREMLEIMKPEFAQKRRSLVEVTNPSQTWGYAYQYPSDCMKPVRILTAGQFATVFNAPEAYPGGVTALWNEEATAHFKREGQMLLAHEPDAVLLYVTDIVNPNIFTPTFVSALGFLLASYLSGPIIRGAEGAKSSQSYRQLALQMAGSSAASQANSSYEGNQHTPSSVAARQ